MADAGEVVIVIGMVFIILCGLVFVTTAYDQSTDPSTDPHAGDQFDDGVQPYNYEAHNKPAPAQPHQDVDLGPSSNPQVEAG